MLISENILAQSARINPYPCYPRFLKSVMAFLPFRKKKIIRTTLFCKEVYYASLALWAITGKTVARNALPKALLLILGIEEIYGGLSEVSSNRD